MLKTNAIQLIEGLFSNYVDGEVVPALEYNANIHMLKKAIEHNGTILQEHNASLKDAFNGLVPAQSISTDRIQNGAITTDKLSEEVKNYTLLNQENTDVLCGDLVSQFHKLNLGITGAFMNGSINPLDTTLQSPIEYTQTANHGVCKVWAEVSNNKYGWVPAVNNSNPIDYSTDISCTSSWEYWVSWITTYTFSEVQTFITNDTTHNFKFTWLGYATRGAVGGGGRGSHTIDTVKFLDNKGNVIAEVGKTNLTDIFTVTATTKTVGQRTEYDGQTITFNRAISKTIENVKSIEITTTDIRESDSSRAKSEFGSLYSPLKPTCTISLGTSTTKRAYADVYQALGKQSKLKINARVRSASEFTANTSINFEVLCTGGTDYEQASATKLALPFSKYLTTDAEITKISEGVDATGKHVYFVTKEFEAPVIISALLTGYKFKDASENVLNIGDTVRKGKKYSWVTKPGTDDYIYTKDVIDVLDSIKNSINEYNANVSNGEEVNFKKPELSFFSIGNNVVDVRLSTNATDIVLDSISVARYAPIVDFDNTEIIAFEDYITDVQEVDEV